MGQQQAGQTATSMDPPACTPPRPPKPHPDTEGSNPSCRNKERRSSQTGSSRAIWRDAPAGRGLPLHRARQCTQLSHRIYTYVCTHLHRKPATAVATRACSTNRCRSQNRGDSQRWLHTGLTSTCRAARLPAARPSWAGQSFCQHLWTQLPNSFVA